MSTGKLITWALLLAVGLLLASLPACKPAPVPTPQAAGVPFQGKISYTEADYILDKYPNQIWWTEGDTLHGRNLINSSDGLYTDERLNGKMTCTYNVDGTRNPPNGIHGRYWGHCLVQAPDGTVTWESDLILERDEQGNSLGNYTFLGRGDYAGLTANVTYTSTLDTGVWNGNGVMIETR